MSGLFPSDLTPGVTFKPPPIFIEPLKRLLGSPPGVGVWGLFDGLGKRGPVVICERKTMLLEVFLHRCTDSLLVAREAAASQAVQSSSCA